MSPSECRKGDHVITPSGRIAKIVRLVGGRVHLLYKDTEVHDDRVVLDPKHLRPWVGYGHATRGRRPLTLI